jgi:hypothetical protein
MEFTLTWWQMVLLFLLGVATPFLSAASYLVVVSQVKAWQYRRRRKSFFK